MSLDAHARPPESMRSLFKKWQKCSLEEIGSSSEILDFANDSIQMNHQICSLTGISKDRQDDLFQRFAPDHHTTATDDASRRSLKFEIKTLPGLFIYPGLLSDEIQIALLNKMLHRDLSNECHQTNVHLHYEVSSLQHRVQSNCAVGPNASFFSLSHDEILYPKNASVHKALTVKQMLQRKLRWMTLGGQYDWTAKKYPSETPPEFPQDIAHLLKGLFPDVDAQAAIVNFYSPGDTLSVHRDVSEECNRGLISASIGCDGLFIAGNEDGSQTATLRLRSGDVVLMSGSSRYAWHAVPKILSGTCPASLQAWPADDEETAFVDWKGWLSNKRVNLNIRQMRTG